ncbi:MAG: sporulation integral membrane protein YlbJ [Clostridia bacterium]|nr:sporulation integral membrane protein YlbJ [Clostridia bacterium]
MVLFSKSNMSSSKEGLYLWANTIVPTLLPFFIATELLSHTFVVGFLGRILNPVMNPVFNVPGEGAFALIIGIISGYPTGAKIVSKFYKDKICTKIEAERLIAFTNNSGPLFIIGTVGISMFGDTRTGILLLITHILACISVGILFRFWKINKEKNVSVLRNKFLINKLENSISFSNLGEILASSIMNSINTILLIGGFVMLFSVIISMLTRSHILPICAFFLKPILNVFKINPELSNGIITGMLELTNGLNSISHIPIKQLSQSVIIASFLTGFGGLSVLLQVYSIISKEGLSIKPYLIGKLLHGIFAAFYTYLFLNFSNFFRLDI